MSSTSRDAGGAKDDDFEAMVRLAGERPPIPHLALSITRIARELGMKAEAQTIAEHALGIIRRHASQ